MTVVSRLALFSVGCIVFSNPFCPQRFLLLLPYLAHMSIDLHIHSTFSDGTLAPAALVTLAKAKRLTAISITDHDTMEGVDEAMSAGRKAGLEVVPGIEISAVFGQLHVHLLGYYVDQSDRQLRSALEDIQVARLGRNQKIMEKLQSLGVPVTLEEVERKSTMGQTGRPHIAQVLVEKGIVSSIDQAFTRYLARGGSAYVARKVLEAVDGIALIAAAGGIPVLAHPATIDNSLRKIPALVEQLVPCGLQGIEVYYPTHSRKNQKQLCGLAQRYDLVVTGGSDYHGDIRPGTMLAGGTNVHVPSVVLDQLKKRLRC
jgi:predicted metal-dependent phosphoesterase TrpH